MKRKNFAIPLYVWKAIQSLKVFCSCNKCEDCPLHIMDDNNFIACPLHNDPETWLRNYHPSNTDYITLEYSEEG